jgi:multimeric flavodoxin WrbA
MTSGDFPDRLAVLTQDRLKDYGWDTEVITLRDVKMSKCTGCWRCWFASPGMCIINDPGREISAKTMRSHLVIYLTPVTFGGYSSALKKMIDRLIPNISPLCVKVGEEVHHEKRYECYPCMLGIGTQTVEDEETEDIFTKLVERNAINFHIPKHHAIVITEDEKSIKIEEELNHIIEDVEQFYA